MFEIAFDGIPLSLLSNSTSQTKIGLFKVNLCEISNDDLIMDWFSRGNLYIIPCVIVSTFGPKIGIWETKLCLLSIDFYEIQIWCLKIKFDDFP